MANGIVTTPFDAITYKIIGCAMSVHRQLGPGLREDSYQKALRTYPKIQVSRMSPQASLINASQFSDFLYQRVAMLRRLANHLNVLSTTHRRGGKSERDTLLSKLEDQSKEITRLSAGIDMLTAQIVAMNATPVFSRSKT